MSSLFTSEAISNYVVFTLGVIFSVIGWLFVRWRARKRPRIIRLVKVNESSLLKIDEQVKDEITITYKDKHVESLYLSEFVLHNITDEVIDDIEIKVNFHDTDVIEVSLEDPIPKRKSVAKKLDSEDSIQLVFPFINPEKLYKERISVKTFSLKPIQIKSVAGGGRGWTVGFLDRQQLVSELVSDLIDVASVSSPVAIITNPFLALRRYIRLVTKILLLPEK